MNATTLSIASTQPGGFKGLDYPEVHSPFVTCPSGAPRTSKVSRWRSLRAESAIKSFFATVVTNPANDAKALCKRGASNIKNAAKYIWSGVKNAGQVIKASAKGIVFGSFFGQVGGGIAGAGVGAGVGMMCGGPIMALPLAAIGGCLGATAGGLVGVAIGAAGNAAWARFGQKNHHIKQQDQQIQQQNQHIQQLEQQLNGQLKKASETADPASA